MRRAALTLASPWSRAGATLDSSSWSRYEYPLELCWERLGGRGGQPSGGRRAGDPVRTEGRKRSGQRARLAGRVGAMGVLARGEWWRVACEPSASCGGAAHRRVLSSSSTKSPATFARGRLPTLIGSTSLRAARLPPSRSASAPPRRQQRRPQRLRPTAGKVKKVEEGAKKGSAHPENRRPPADGGEVWSRPSGDSL